MNVRQSQLRKRNLVGRCRSGKILFSSKDKFKVVFLGSNHEEFFFLYRKDSIEYNAPPMKKEVICIYSENEGNRYVSEVRSKGWELYFRKEI